LVYCGVVFGVGVWDCTFGEEIFELVTEFLKRWEGSVSGFTVYGVRELFELSVKFGENWGVVGFNMAGSGSGGWIMELKFDNGEDGRY
jgi:hypothetical protein